MSAASDTKPERYMERWRKAFAGGEPPREMREGTAMSLTRSQRDRIANVHARRVSATTGVLEEARWRPDTLEESETWIRTALWILRGSCPVGVLGADPFDLVAMYNSAHPQEDRGVVTPPDLYRSADSGREFRACQNRGSEIVRLIPWSTRLARPRENEKVRVVSLVDWIRMSWRRTRALAPERMT